MKKILAMVGLCLIGTGAFAQTGSGTIVLSGSVGYSKTTQDDNASQEVDQTTFNLSPSVGYFIQDGLELGIGLGFNQTSNGILVPDGWGMSEYEMKTNLFSFNPYIRKYFMVSDKVAFTGSATAGFSTGSSSISLDGGREYKSEVSGFQVAVVPGLSFFPTEKIGITAAFGSLGYSELSSKPEEGDDKTTSSTVGLNLNASTLSIGFSYHFGR
ncbi:outer membrane beta-barrel protein [Pontibacter sp. Tf4]|uniref:outer membrane beta-barrel protein n=1 Tax=Pontibacter sp. Tf4 TaxID=2761620 RepID=UPI001625D623|nr:outer membrane beta-barrel protein [Pontibacter sp. Tf4]MBB6611715.1 outer membrane beta-barrel protein [Pontibacter sp. Tf4]